MRKVNGKTCGMIRKSLAVALTAALTVSSLTVATADAKTKAKGTVKSVKISSPVVNGGKLVLKKGQKKQIKYTVTAAKGTSKKVTVTSSNTKAVKVVKKGSKYFAKAVAAKGSAKITVASKVNSKKKSTLKVKIGNPIKKIKSASVLRTQTVEDYTYLNQLKKEGKLSLTEAEKKARTITKKKLSASKTIEVCTVYTDKTDSAHEKRITYTYKLSTVTNPAKPAVSAIKWKSSKPSLVSVDAGGNIIIRKQKDLSKEKDYSMGSCVLTGYTKDGSNKTIKVKVKVTAKANIEPPRVYEKDTREGTMVEDFESYEVGTTWKQYTAGGYADSGTMTVVKDPENPDNKVLKVDYTGKDQAYDFAPAFTVNLPDGKVMRDYSAVRLKSRVISNSSDCNYKTIGVFFDGKGTIKADDYFYTANYTGTTGGKDASEQKYRFGSAVSMATGVDENYNVPASVVEGNAILNEDIIATSPYKKYNNKVFPTFYTAYSTGDTSAVSPGYAEDEKEGVTVGFQQNTLEFNTTMIEAAWISDDDTTPLLDRNTFDMVLGSTYKGSQGLAYADYHLILYIDDIEFMSGDIPCTSIELSGSDKLAQGAAVTLETKFTPANTTQTDVEWNSSDESIAKVDAFGKVTASAVNTGTVTITCTCKANPSVKQTHEITVFKPQIANNDFDALKGASIVPKSDDEKTAVKSETDAVLTDAGLQINFTKNNESIVLDLGKSIDMTAYKSVVLTGTTPGQISMEFYSDTLDMTQSKDSGAEEDWWNTKQGGTYPFYNGSCAYRYEGGGFNKTRTGGAIATEETSRYSLATLSEGNKGNWTNIRYVIIKSNNSPTKPKGWGANNYFITSFRFSTGEVMETPNAGHYDLDLEKNLAEIDGNKKSYYIDNITEENTVENHDSTMNLTDMKYIKVKVKDTTSVKVGLISNGKKLADAEIIGEETGGSEDRSVYVSLAGLYATMDLENIDAISVEVDEGGTVEAISLTKGEISYSKKEKKIDLSGSSATVVTEDVYGTES